jgi:hypothetical protein
LGDDYADDLAGENNLMGAVVAAERSSPGFGAGFTTGVAAAKARRSTDSDEEQLGSLARRVSSWEAKREGKKSPHRCLVPPLSSTIAEEDLREARGLSPVPLRGLSSDLATRDLPAHWEEAEE